MKTVDLKPLLERAKDETNPLKSLEELLASEGISFRSDKQFIKFLEKSWKESNSEALEAARNEPLAELTVLPYSEVRCGGTVYKIHGIIHGIHMIQPSKKLKALVRDSIMQNSQGEYDNSHVKIERGFVDLFELNDLNYVRISELPAIDPHWLGSNSEIMKANSQLLLNRMAAIVSSRVNADSRNLLRAVRDPKYLQRARKIISALMMPEPFNLQKNYRRGGLYFALAKWSDRMADSLTDSYTHLECSLTRAPEEMHVIIGMGHESELVHLISNKHDNYMQYHAPHVESLEYRSFIFRDIAKIKA